MMAFSTTHLRSVVDVDGAAILDLDRDVIVTLNSTGGYVWAQLQQGKLVDEIILNLASESGADLVIVDRDVRGFLQQLRAKHLL